MATAIKIYVAGGADGIGDGDAETDLSLDQAKAVAHLLANLTYAEIYHHVPSNGDGNAPGSKSDRETCTTRDGLSLIRRAFDRALRR